MVKILGKNIDIIKVSEDMPEEIYHNHPAISKSKLSGIGENPLKFWFWNVNPERPEKASTPAQVLGSATHYAILEPEKFKSEVVKEPKINRRTNAGKEEAAAFEEKNKGKTILKADDYRMVMGMQEAVRKVHADMLSTISQTEVSIFATIDGANVRARMDAISPGCIIDLKTTDDASYKGFLRSVQKYRYDVQAGLYSALYTAWKGKKPSAFWFLCVEKKSPYSTAIYKLDDDYIRHGLETFYSWLDIYIKCRDENKWPDYNNGERTTIELPKYLREDKNAR